MSGVEMIQPQRASSRVAERWLTAGRLAATHSLIGLPPLFVAWVLVTGFGRDAIAFDFIHAYLPAAHAVFAGESPYPDATVAALAPRDAFVYPPLSAFLVVPFTVLPVTVAGLAASLLVVACLLAALRAMDVRDWRCYSIALVWLPVYSAIQTANVTAMLVLGLALLWRYRDRPAAPLAVGFLIALKLFLWPLLLWFVATRRYRGAGAGLVIGALLVAGPWAVIGFSGLREFPHLLETLSRLQQLDSYTVGALLASVMQGSAAHAVGMTLGFTVAGAAFLVGRKDERRSYALFIGAALLLSPVVHVHYFAVLLVVVALFSSRLDWLWAVPLVLWLSPQVSTAAAFWQTALALIIVTATVAVGLRRGLTRLDREPSRVGGDEAYA